MHRFVIAILIILNICASHCLGQAVGASVAGTVKDPQGSAMPGAVAKFTNTATGVVTSTLTNDSGNYRAANLQPGAYELTIASPGFAMTVQKGINLTVGAELL